METKNIIGNWKNTDFRPNYLVWSLPLKIGYNPFDIVVKTEENNWVTFISTGSFGGGTQVLNRGNTKQFNVDIAIKYMKDNPM